VPQNSKITRKPPGHEGEPDTPENPFEGIRGWVEAEVDRVGRTVKPEALPVEEDTSGFVDRSIDPRRTMRHAGQRALIGNVARAAPENIIESDVSRAV
jgi:hypothetical protein